MTTTTETPTLNANQLRYLAEKADGLRDRPLALVIDGQGRVDVVPEAEAGQDTVLLKLATEPRGPGVAGTAKIHLRWNDRTYGGPSSKLDAADAVFVTQSAIEKFLLPYYMRFKSGAQVQALENTLYNDAGVAAAIHIPPSITTAFPQVCAVSLSAPDTIDLQSV